MWSSHYQKIYILSVQATPFSIHHIVRSSGSPDYLLIVPSMEARVSQDWASD